MTCPINQPNSGSTMYNTNYQIPRTLLCASICEIKAFFNSCQLNYSRRHVCTSLPSILFVYLHHPPPVQHDFVIVILCNLGMKNKPLYAWSFLCYTEFYDCKNDAAIVKCAYCKMHANVKPSSLTFNIAHSTEQMVGGCIVGVSIWNYYSVNGYRWALPPHSCIGCILIVILEGLLFLPYQWYCRAYHAELCNGLWVLRNRV